MILFRESQPPLLADYGIEVPMLKGRAQRVNQELIKAFGESIFSNASSPLLTEADFLRAHGESFIQKCKNSPDEVIKETFELINKDGSFNRYNPKNATKNLAELVDLYRDSCGDSYLTLLEAQKKGFSYYLGGGFHHSLSTRGRGFCLFNDIVIAAKKYQAEVNQGDIWVIDIDAHKGCGTAEMTQKDESIKTLSIHMKNGWPLDSNEFDEDGNQNPWFIPSSIDIGISSGEESSYLDRLKEGLSKLATLSKAKPVMAIVVDGSDPFEQDALPSADLLKLSQKQCLERNEMVYQFLKQQGIPQAYLMSGGYGDKNWIIHYQFIEKVLKGDN